MRRLLFLGSLIGAFTCIAWGFNSYVKTGWRLTSEHWSESVPLEFQIERLRDMVVDLQQDIRKQYLVVAKEQVDVEDVHEEVERKQADLARDENELKVLSRLLESPKEQFVILNRTHPRADVERDVRSRFDQYKLDEENLASLREILASREGCLETAREKLRSFAVDKRKLESRVEQLRLRAERLATTDAASQIRIDGSRLSEINELTADLEARLRAMEAIAQAEVDSAGRIQLGPTDDASDGDVAHQVLSYFGEMEVAAAR